MSAVDSRNWADLPDHIVINAMSYLNLQDKYHAAITCKSWYSCFSMAPVWSRLLIYFYVQKQEKYLMCVNKYGQHVKSLYIELDQAVSTNRNNACKVLKSLAETSKRKLHSLTIKFTGDNPLFFAGAEFIEALKCLFGPVTDNIEPPVRQITDVNLRGLGVPYGDDVFKILANNNPELEKLDIQNKIIVCKVTPSGLLHVVESCKKLKELRVYYCSMSDEVLEALASEDREPIQRLSIICRREEKYNKELSSEAWTALVKKSANLQVTLGFDHTCPLHKIASIMKFEIPVVELRFETYTRLFDEVNQAATYYKNTLEKLVLYTLNSESLEQALLNIARTCKRLESLYVDCDLKKSVIETILAICPKMREKSSYRLPLEVHPEYVVGVEVSD